MKPTLLREIMEIVQHKLNLCYLFKAYEGNQIIASYRHNLQD